MMESKSTSFSAMAAGAYCWPFGVKSVGSKGWPRAGVEGWWKSFRGKQCLAIPLKLRCVPDLKRVRETFTGGEGWLEAPQIVSARRRRRKHATAGGATGQRGSITTVGTKIPGDGLRSRAGAWRRGQREALLWPEAVEWDAPSDFTAWKARSSLLAKGGTGRGRELLGQAGWAGLG